MQVWKFCKIFAMFGRDLARIAELRVEIWHAGSLYLNSGVCRVSRSFIFFLDLARARARARRPGERGHASGWRRSPANACGKGGGRGMSAARTFDFSDMFVSSSSCVSLHDFFWIVHFLAQQMHIFWPNFAASRTATKKCDPYERDFLKFQRNLSNFAIFEGFEENSLICAHNWVALLSSGAKSELMRQNLIEQAT